MSAPNRTRLALLGFLSWGPMNGYRLKQAFADAATYCMGD